MSWSDWEPYPLPTDPDPLAPMSGVIVGLLLSVPLWALLGGLVWWISR